MKRRLWIAGGLLLVAAVVIALFLLFTGGQDNTATIVEAINTGSRARAMAFQNFGVALVYNAVCVPLAMAGFVTPLIAAIVMSSSSILVTLNATRLAGGPIS